MSLTCLLWADYEAELVLAKLVKGGILVCSRFLWIPCLGWGTVCSVSSRCQFAIYAAAEPSLWLAELSRLGFQRGVFHDYKLHIKPKGRSERY
jgi:hypothetical protein